MIGHISDYNLDGYVYDFRYYNRALSSTEIKNVYHYNILGDEVLQMSTLGNYKYYLKHSIGKDNIITVKNNDAVSEYLLTNGKLNGNYDNKKYFKLTGNNNLEMAHTQLLNTLSFTVSIWVYCYNDTNAYQTVFVSRGTDGQYSGYNLYINNSDKWDFGLEDQVVGLK